MGLKPGIFGGQRRPTSAHPSPAGSPGRWEALGLGLERAYVASRCVWGGCLIFLGGPGLAKVL